MGMGMMCVFVWFFHYCSFIKTKELGDRVKSSETWVTTVLPRGQRHCVLASVYAVFCAKSGTDRVWLVTSLCASRRTAGRCCRWWPVQPVQQAVCNSLTVLRCHSSGRVSNGRHAQCLPQVFIIHISPCIMFIIYMSPCISSACHPSQCRLCSTPSRRYYYVGGISFAFYLYSSKHISLSWHFFLARWRWLSYLGFHNTGQTSVTILDRPVWSLAAEHWHLLPFFP